MAVKMRPSSTVAQITLPNMLKPENASTYAISRPSRTRLNPPERMPTYSGTERNSVTTTMATEPTTTSAQVVESAPVTAPCGSTCRPLKLAPIVAAAITAAATAGTRLAISMPTISGPMSLTNSPHASLNSLPMSTASTSRAAGSRRLSDGRIDQMALAVGLEVHAEHVGHTERRGHEAQDDAHDGDDAEDADDHADHDGAHQPGHEGGEVARARGHVLALRQRLAHTAAAVADQRQSVQPDRREDETRDDEEDVADADDDAEDHGGHRERADLVEALQIGVFGPATFTDAAEDHAEGHSVHPGVDDHRDDHQQDHREERRPNGKAREAPGVDNPDAAAQGQPDDHVDHADDDGRDQRRDHERPPIEPEEPPGILEALADVHLVALRHEVYRSARLRPKWCLRPRPLLPLAQSCASVPEETF